MKKSFTILFAVLMLSGCQKAGTSTPLAPTPTAKEPLPNVFATIRDAVTKSLMLKCEYTDDNNQTVITYIKGTSVRLNGTGTEAKINGIMKDGQFYLWEIGKNKGMKLDIAKLATGGSLKMDGTVIKSEDDVIGVLERHKDKCQVSPGDVSMMDLPGGVDFTASSDLF